MAAKEEKNLFASPWNDSDIVLVVEDKELHVHRWILTSQSPVFKSMLDGHFREASQNKIVLPGKDFKSVQLFLKLLYPSSMFEEDVTPLHNENRLSVLALADEYQCVNLIKQCINKTKIMPSNAMEVLPYAVKYHESALPKVFKVISFSTSTDQLKEIWPNLESKTTSIEMFSAKCHFLESTVISMQKTILSLMCTLSQNEKKHDIFMHSYLYKKTTVDSRCGHEIGILDLAKTKSCQYCKEKYKEIFIKPILQITSISPNTQEFFNMLMEGQSISDSVSEGNKKEKKELGLARKPKFF